MPIDTYDSATPEPEFEGMGIEEMIEFLDERDREAAYARETEEYLRRNRFNYPDPVM